MNALFEKFPVSLVPLIAALAVAPAAAQVPVDGSGAPLADYESFEAGTPAGGKDIPFLTQTELQDLVGPIALYPDDLLAIVLPASTYPLQLVQAQRFLENLEEDPSLKPDDSWDDSVIALLNYPEVVALLNEDLDWTWRLGEAVVAQQADVVGAVEGFRDRAYAAGNLKSDARQTVARDGGTIEIMPVEDDVIYVPYYEPERVVHYQSRPVYHYYPRAYPVYYYPYPVGHAFNRGFFWGVTTAFTVGWLTDSVHVVHHSYHGHPYYGHRYWDGWWYRRPTINVHNHYYSTNRHSVSRNRYSRGDYWRPRHDTRRRLHNERITRSDYYTGRTVQHRSQATTASRDLERRRSVHTAAPEHRRQQRQAAVPSTTRQAPRRTQPERRVEERQRSRVERQPLRTERTARHEQRAAEHRGSERRTGARRISEPRASEWRIRETRAAEPRQERRAAAPRRQEPPQSRQQPAQEKKSVRSAERRKHASSRGDSARRQRH